MVMNSEGFADACLMSGEKPGYNSGLTPDRDRLQNGYLIILLEEIYDWWLVANIS